MGIKCNVVTYTHLFKGQKEDEAIIQSTTLPFIGNDLYKQRKIIWNEGHSAWYWEGLGRYIATQEMVGKDCHYILYIDADEIIEPQRATQFINSNIITNYTAIKLGVYTYSIDVHCRLRVKAYSTILSKYSFANSLPFKEDGRLQYFNNSDRVSRWTAKLSINPRFYIYKGIPFIHHYTGVRTPDQMVKKVTSWGHSDEKDWIAELNRSWKINKGKIGKHRFDIVENTFNL